ncbi:acyl-CoA dehydrogenase family protein [Pseudomonas fluorescens]|uniref:acyl-CoA dehydrogenase family protein n=1 Tax=Pseudomonas fluorescens TaxID=294 RepID=UPI0019128DF8|nr:acyl-CoA dehydrogenase family protein [Pseudomonas fluorescens]
MSTFDDRRENIRMIRDSAVSFASRGHAERVRSLRYKLPGIDRNVWQEIADNGWLGLTIPEYQGGVGLGMSEYVALAHELGGILLPEPFIAAVMATRLADEQTRRAILAGERVILPAWQDTRTTLNTDDSAIQIDANLLTGKKVCVSMGAAAEAFIVTTREGIALVDADQPGVHIDTEMTQDGGHFATLTLIRTEASITPVSSSTINDAVDESILAIAAYLLGVADKAFALTLDYLNTRKQFGHLIGSFQVLQHRAVDLKLQLELLRASVQSAASLWDSGGSRELRQAAISRAKARAADVSLLVTRQAVQMHGAIGYTDECDIGLFLRKAMTLANSYGSAAVHRKRYDSLLSQTA